MRQNKWELRGDLGAVMEVFRSFNLNFGPTPYRLSDLIAPQFHQRFDVLFPALSQTNTNTKTLVLSEQSTSMTLPTQQLRPGALVAGRYEIVSLICSGGMGVIYKAKHLLLDKFCAIKMLHHHRMHEKALQRFEQEARATSKLTHPKLITVHDFGFSEDGHPFMVMDLIEGVSLSDFIGDRGGLGCEQAVNIFLQICDGMQYAHEQGVLHRDLKPSNVMLADVETQTPEAKVVDFGIAKIDCGPDQTAVAVTQSGEILGSPLYMSPEQATGRHVDKRSDIYSMGCLMYETLTGRPPFKGDSTLETMIQHLRSEPPTLAEKSACRSFPKELDVVMQKALAKDPDQRYQSMLALRHDLLKC